MELRDVDKKTFRVIGQELGVSATRARAIYKDAQWRKKYHSGGEEAYPFYGVSTRAAHICHNLGLLCKKDVKAAILDGRLKVGKTHNYGWKTQAELVKWVGLPPLIKLKRHINACPHCGKSLNLKSK